MFTLVSCSVAFCAHRSKADWTRKEVLHKYSDGVNRCLRAMQYLLNKCAKLQRATEFLLCALYVSVVNWRAPDTQLISDLVHVFRVRSWLIPPSLSITLVSI
jgi:hypothetical protein